MKLHVALSKNLSNSTNTDEEDNEDESVKIKKELRKKLAKGKADKTLLKNK